MAGDETKVAEVSRQTLGAWRLGGRRPSGTRLFRRFTGVRLMKIAFPKAFVKAKSTQTQNFFIQSNKNKKRIEMAGDETKVAEPTAHTAPDELTLHN